MSLYKTIIKIFAPKKSKAAPVSPTYAERVKDIEARVIATYAEGNTFLQHQQIWTTQDIEKEAERICEIDFSKYKIAEN